MTLFYLSFASERAFLGATVVEAADAEAAVAEASRRGLNPGGEIAVLAVPPDAEDERDVLALRNRLLNERAMLALGGSKIAGRSPADRAFARAAELVCEDCNPPKGRRS